MSFNKLDPMPAHPYRERSRRPQSMIVLPSNGQRQTSDDTPVQEALGLFPGQLINGSATISHQGFQLLLREMETYDSRINKRKSGFFGSSTFSLSSKSRTAEGPKEEDSGKTDTGMTMKKKRKLEFPFHSRRSSKSSSDFYRTKENDDKVADQKRNSLQISVEAMHMAKQMPRTKMELQDWPCNHSYPSSNVRQSQSQSCADFCQNKFEPELSAHTKSYLTRNFQTDHSNSNKKMKPTSIQQNEQEMLEPISETKQEVVSLRRKPKSPYKVGWRKSARFSLVENNNTVHEMEKSISDRRLSSETASLSSSSNSSSNEEENNYDAPMKQKHVKLRNKSSIRSLLKSWVNTKSQEKQKVTNCDPRNEEPAIHLRLSLKETLSCEGEARKRFAEFLKKEFSYENLEFWIEVEKYKDLKDFKSAARNIFNNFISNFAPREINIEARVRKEIASKVEDPHPSIFDEAQKHIFTLMENDSFRRFLDCHSKTKP